MSYLLILNRIITYFNKKEEIDPRKECLDEIIRQINEKRFKVQHLYIDDFPSERNRRNEIIDKIIRLKRQQAVYHLNLCVTDFSDNPEIYTTIETMAAIIPKNAQKMSIAIVESPTYKLRLSEFYNNIRQWAFDRYPERVTQDALEGDRKELDKLFENYFTEFALERIYKPLPRSLLYLSIKVDNDKMNSNIK